MRILAIDYGQKRVGLAVSDPTGTLASPLRTLQNEGREALLHAVAAAVLEVAPARVVVGLPVRTDGTLRDEARKVLKFAHQLAARIDVPVTSCDEAFTTAEAIARLQSMGGRRRDPRKDRAFIDQMAAVLLLEDYLSQCPATPAPLPPLPPAPEPR
jgi:putative Holliday junction resolvase